MRVSAMKPRTASDTATEIHAPREKLMTRAGAMKRNSAGRKSGCVRADASNLPAEIGHRRSDRRAEYIWILERAACTTVFREQVIGAGHQFEVADVAK